MELLRNLVLVVTDFMFEQLLSRKLVSVKILTPYFEYLKKLEDYKYYPASNTKNVVMTSVKCIKSRFLNVLLDIMDARKSNSLNIEEANEFPSIRDEMMVDPLTSPELMEQYLVILRMVSSEPL